jgi:hypothetical protein
VGEALCRLTMERAASLLVLGRYGVGTEVRRAKAAMRSGCCVSGSASDKYAVGSF